MGQKTRAIILHTTEYSSSSVVVKAYTEQFGAQSYIAGGVRKIRSKHSMNFFQPLSLVEVVAVNKNNSGMSRITDIAWAPHFNNIPNDMVRTSIALFLAEVLYRSIKEEEKNPTLFEFLHNSIQMLDAEFADCSKFHLACLIQLTKHLGFYPHGKYVSGSTCFDLREGVFTASSPLHQEFITPEIAGYLNAFVKEGYANYKEIQINNSRKRQLLNALVMYYELHQTHGVAIRSHKVLNEIMST